MRPLCVPTLMGLIPAFTWLGKDKKHTQAGIEIALRMVEAEKNGFTIRHCLGPVICVTACVVSRVRPSRPCPYPLDRRSPSYQ